MQERRLELIRRDISRRVLVFGLICLDLETLTNQDRFLYGAILS